MMLNEIFQITKEYRKKDVHTDEEDFLVEEAILAQIELIPDDRKVWEYNLASHYWDCSKLTATYNGQILEINIFKEEDDSLSVFFNGKWYRSFREFIGRAAIDGKIVRHIANQIKIS